MDHGTRHVYMNVRRWHLYQIAKFGHEDFLRLDRRCVAVRVSARSHLKLSNRIRNNSDNSGNMKDP